jgi:hypothetical protein
VLAEVCAQMAKKRSAIQVRPLPRDFSIADVLWWNELGSFILVGQLFETDVGTVECALAVVLQDAQEISIELPGMASVLCLTPNLAAAPVVVCEADASVERPVPLSD